MLKTTPAHAAEKLLTALIENKTGFVARVELQPAMLAVAESTALARRVCARLTKQRGERDYAKASRVPPGSEYGQLAADRRGVLAELLVGDLLALADADFDMQPLVSHRTQPGADVIVAGRKFDIKSASQASADWSPGPAGSGRFTDDRLMLLNTIEHERYCRDDAHRGYISVYFYMRDGKPWAADVFYFSIADIEHATHNAGTWPYVSARMNYMSLPLPFPDSLYSDGRFERIESLLAAGYSEVAA